MLLVREPGILTTVQDIGRFGYQGYGIPVSGAMDCYALSIANALVQNSLNDAAIEIHAPVAFETDSPALIAITGADAALKINGRVMPAWTANFVRPGYAIEIAPRSGGWQYLAVHGGIDVPPVLGSRSTYLRGKFGGLGGHALQMEDEIPIGRPRLSDWVSSAGKTAKDRNSANRERTIRVLLGPNIDRFSDQAVAALQQQEYIVTASADRMGYRLLGTALASHRTDELISCGVPLGGIQVPADGQPIALMADHQTTGGYPIIATIASADLRILAQSAPGDAVHFRVVEVEDAQRAWKELWDIVESLRA